jgi:hypothetical protein
MQESVPAGSCQRVSLFGQTAMGILDDAIRDHLELVRKRGATDSEVRRLEDEAFGPPTRPDEADFPESEQGASSGNGVAAEPVAEEPFWEGAAAHEDATTLLPAEKGEEPSAGTGLEEPTGAHVTADVDEPEGEPVLGQREGEEPAAEVAEDEPVAGEHPIVGETPIDPAGEPDPGEAAGTRAEAAPLYDQAEDEGMDLDVDLAAEGEAAVEEAPSEEHSPGEPEGPETLDPPIESLETVEHPFPGEITDDEPHEEGAPPDEAVHEEDQPEGEREEDAEGSDEDVLADTPEFLKDQPEDDELWFEQGEPKDFDF